MFSVFAETVYNLRSELSNKVIYRKIMVEDLRVQAKWAALPEVAKLLPLPNFCNIFLQSRLIAWHVNRYANMIIYSEFCQKCNNLSGVFFAILLRRMMHSLAPWFLSRYNFYIVSLYVFLLSLYSFCCIGCRRYDCC